MSQFQTFARLVKVDEAKRQVIGILADETPDAAGEVFDYESSKPHFQKWSGEVAKATAGKSVGNLRAQHGRVVAGKLSELTLDDSEKQVRIVGDIVDDNEWNKVLQGCYTGFSVGGSYGKKWEDKDLGKTRYTAKPVEASIVDLPCNPNTGFTVIKANGEEELRKFLEGPDVELLRTILIKVVEGTEDNDFLKFLDGELLKIAARSDADPKEGESKYGDVKYADATNKKYPIDTPAHIRAAWNYINMPKNAAKYSGADARSIKSKIVSAWKSKIDAGGPPSAKKSLDGEDLYKVAVEAYAEHLLGIEKAKPVLASLAALAGDKLEKGLWTIGRLADCVANVFCIYQDARMEADYEGDGSVLPDELMDAAKALGEILSHMVDEELEELFGAESNSDSTLEASMKPEELQKSVQDAFTKAIESEDFSKVLAKVLDGGVLAKALEEPLKKFNERLEKLEKQPAPGGPIVAVAKGTEVAITEPDAPKPVMVNGQEDKGATLVKALHARGGQPFQRN